MLATLWGAAFVAISAGLSYIPPILFAALRYDIAGIVMLGYAAVAVDRWRPRTGAEWRQVAVGAVLLIAAYHAFLFVGQQHTTAAAAAILVSLSPVLSTGFARALVPADALSPVGIVGVVVGLAGVAVIVRPDPSNLLATGIVAKGSFSVLRRRSRSAASSPAVSIPRCRSRRWKPGRCSAARSCYTSSASRSASRSSRPRGPTPRQSVRWPISRSARARSAFRLLRPARATGAVEINMVSYVAPIVTAVVGWLYLGEVVDTATLIGFGLIAVSFCLVKRRAIRREFGHVRSRGSSE